MLKVDLRSDTVTLPTPAMRQAMADAPVGDDIYGEDPSVAALEEAVAAELGKETALYVPSGTMANQLALALHCESGDQVFCGRDAHIGLYEGGAAGAIAGVQLREVDGPGTFDADALRRRLHGDAFYYPRPRLVCLENTHNQSGGRLFATEDVRAIAELAKEKGLRMHLDGARLWNASIALGQRPSQLAEDFDTVSVCFSKGLGAPVGSAVAMPKALRQKALRLRRRFGGAMRQAGILAVAASHALEHHFDALSEDHRRAQRLADGLAANGFEVLTPETNIVVFEAGDAAAFVARAQELGVLLGAITESRVRAVTHRDLDDGAIDAALGVFAKCA